MKRLFFVLAVLSAAVVESAQPNAAVKDVEVEPPFRPITVDVEGVPAEGLFNYNFWRIQTSAEKTNGMHRLCKVWRDATSCQAIPDGCDSRLEVTELKDGRFFVDWYFTVVSTNLPPLPRVGITFPVRKTFTNVRWHGRGPWENYPSRREGTKLGVYAANMSLVSDINNPDFGYRSACRWVEVVEPTGRGIRIDAVNAPFGFSIRPTSKVEDGYYVRVDAYISGEIVPGQTSHKRPETYHLSLLMSEI